MHHEQAACVGPPTRLVIYPTLDHYRHDLPALVYLARIPHSASHRSPLSSFRPCLQILDLSYNRLSQMPACISRCIALERLNLSQNIPLAPGSTVPPVRLPPMELRVSDARLLAGLPHLTGLALYTDDALAGEPASLSDESSDESEDEEVSRAV